MKMIRPSSAVSNLSDVSDDSSKMAKRSVAGHVLGYGQGLFDVANGPNSSFYNEKKSKKNKIKGSPN